MSRDAMKFADQQSLKPRNSAVLMHLAKRHQPGRGCFPSYEDIAKSCNLSRTSVYNALGDLEKFGLIRRKPRHDTKSGKRTSNTYYFPFDPEFHTDIANGKASPNTISPAGTPSFHKVQNLNLVPSSERELNPVQNPNPNRYKHKYIQSAPALRGRSATSQWPGDPDIRMRIIADPQFGEGFAVSYLDRAVPVGDGIIRAATNTARGKLRQCVVLRGFTILGPSDAIPSSLVQN